MASSKPVSSGKPYGRARPARLAIPVSIAWIRMKSAALSGMITDRVYPTYPASARAKQIGGEVRLSVRIGKNGRVLEVNVEAGPPELHKAAIDAMKKWRFKPIQIDGYPVEVETEFLFNLQAAPR